MSTNTDIASIVNNTAWIQVAVLGGDVHQLDFTSGMTVSDALDIAGVRQQQGLMLQVNGREAKPKDNLEPNSVVQVTSKVMNG